MFVAQAEAGNVRVVRGRWNGEYIEEMTTFPNGAFDDQVDATSGAFNELPKNATMLRQIDMGGGILRPQPNPMMPGSARPLATLMMNGMVISSRGFGR